MPILLLAYLVTMITHFWGDFHSIQWESLSRHLSKQSSSVHALPSKIFSTLKFRFSEKFIKSFQLVLDVYSLGFTRRTQKSPWWFLVYKENFKSIWLFCQFFVAFSENLKFSTFFSGKWCALNIKICLLCLVAVICSPEINQHEKTCQFTIQLFLESLYYLNNIWITWMQRQPWMTLARVFSSA